MRRSSGFFAFLGAVFAAVLSLWLGGGSSPPLFESEAHREQAIERLREMRNATPAED